jgi:hypothetical protein
MDVLEPAGRSVASLDRRSSCSKGAVVAIDDPRAHGFRGAELWSPTARTPFQDNPIGKLHYRRTQDPTGFPDQRLPMHVLEGVGDLYALLRGDMPVRPQSRKLILEAGPGESEYIRYDRAIAKLAAEWIHAEGHRHLRPWAWS